MTKVGYRRVSSIDQNLDRQELDCDKIFEEKVSAGSRNRPALDEMLDWIREEDEIIVHSIDRLARDLQDLQAIVQKVNAKNVTISFLTEGLRFSPYNDDPISKLQLQMMGAFAEFERSIIRKRQAEGIIKAKQLGVYKGRKPSIDVERVKALKASGVGGTAIAKELGIGRASVYRVLNKA